MTVLSNQDRSDVCADFQRTPENVAALGTLTKAQLLAAVAAADQWSDDNASAYNLSLPAAARGALSGRQKAALLLYVIRRRWELS